MEKQEDKAKSLKTGFRVAQAISLGIFTIGISMMLGDLSGAWQLPISSISLTTTLFGGMGTIICEIMARKAESW